MIATQKKNTALVSLGQLLLEFLQCHLTDDVLSIAVNGLSIHSQAIAPGDVFCAVRGVATHGKKYVDDAIKRGAVAVLSDTNIDAKNDAVPVIVVPDLQHLLSEIAGNFYQHPTRHVPVVGITGTNGKTSCAQMYAQLSALMGSVTGVIGTTGAGICALETNQQYRTHTSLASTGMTTPDAVSVQRICADLVSPVRAYQENSSPVNTLVMEVSSHGLSQGRVAAVDINTAIFTNLSHDHLDYHGDMQSYGEAKSLLFTMPSLSHAIVNMDDAFAATLEKKIAASVRVTRYSVHNTCADIYLSHIRYANGQVLADVHRNGVIYSLSSPFVGEFNLSNLLAILSTFSQPEDFEKAISLVPYLTPIAGRMESLDNNVGIQVIVDFAHTPDALGHALQAICRQSTGDVYCVFGCGGDRDTAKRPLMAAMAERYAQHIIVTSDNPRNENPEKIISDITVGFKQSGYRVEIDREQAIHTAIRQAQAGDTVLIAGKGHENFQIIGKEKRYFSDQDVARKALHQKECGE